MLQVIDDGSPVVIKSKEERVEERRARRRAAAGTRSSSNAREITIASCANTSPLEITLQKSYTGSGIISSDEASARPSSGEAALKQVNELLGTAYTSNEYPVLAQTFDRWISEGYDFGLLYSRCRAEWVRTPVLGLQHVDERIEEDEKARASARDAQLNMITRPSIPPRRVWDLWSNRVVPYSYASRLSAAVSHSWAEEARRQSVTTDINGGEWTVPIPRETTLERVRVELLNLGFEYAWLDVLCLRQQSTDPRRETIRHAEWEIDVPTIGGVYHSTAMIVHYYSGLGLPFRIENLHGERHWLNRAWTLQEVSASSIIAGVTALSPVDGRYAYDAETGEINDPDIRRFYTTLASLIAQSQSSDSVFQDLHAMRHRAACSELDKIAGLAYKLKSSALPPYIVGQDPELAWDALVAAIAPQFRGDLLFLFPEPGHGDQRRRWHPSWAQIKSARYLPLNSEGMYEPVTFFERRRLFIHEGYRFDDCDVNGLDTIPSDGERRRGQAVIRSRSRQEHTLAIFAVHFHPIPSGRYTLVSCAGHQIWLAGLTGHYGTIEKVSVFRSESAAAQDFQQSFNGHDVLAEYRRTCYYV